MRNQIQRYLNLPNQLKFFIASSFLLGLNNSVYFLIANIYMSKQGFTDVEIANCVTYRFALVMLFAVPFGMLIKTRKLKPFYYFASVMLPILSFIMVYSIENYNLNLLYFTLLFFGFCFMLVAISGLPFILRNAEKKYHTETIAANYATWSLGQIFVGFLIFALSNLFPDFFTERRLIQLVAIISLISIYCLYKLGDEKAPKTTKISGFQFNQYNWKIILEAIVPTALIAVGAGLSIPFMNLFFYKIFGLDFDTFSVLASVTAVIVGFTSFIVPSIKRKFGYEAITYSQSIGVFALFCLATTSYFSEFKFVLFIAMFLYLIRQPLMSLAGPLTSQMTMYYVGKRNEEMLSALQAAIWSGSWFISSMIFGKLRGLEVSFGNIFYITASIYVIGVFMYWLLIKKFRKIYPKRIE